MQQVTELAIPARAEFISLVRLVVGAVAHGTRDIDDERIADLKLAVSEACTNAIEAQDAIEAGDLVLVRCYDGSDRFEVTVNDQGRGFDPSVLPLHPPVTDPRRLEFERGLGIPLIRALVDDVQFSSSEVGTSVRLVMYCARASEG